ncbi:MAG TPA: GNAT family N-acetyltransferase [Gemmatimonadaceae bacterium]|nr:GNAT family N-acetyltransferase [Gemmatimonadaceae bacterium]
MTSVDTSRPLLLRPWRADDLLPLRAAIDESLPEVQRWLPWGKEEPSSLEHLAARLERYAQDFAAGTTWRMAIVDPTDGTLLGTGVLLRCSAPDALEVGYWVRTRAAGQGIATRATAALVRHAFDVHRVARLELWTLPGNDASMAVARRLGFVWRERLETSRQGTPPDVYEIFDLLSLDALRAPTDPNVRIELA